MLLLLAAQANEEPNWVAVLLGIAFPLAFLIPLFLVMRWQIKLMNDLRDTLHRIADSIEAIAQRR
jgi:hypothetical protein